MTRTDSTGTDPDPRFACGATGPCCGDCAEFVGCVADPFVPAWKGWADPAFAAMSALQRVARRLRWLAGQLVIDHDAKAFADLADWIDTLAADDEAAHPPIVVSTVPLTDDQVDDLRDRVRHRYESGGPIPVTLHTTGVHTPLSRAAFAKMCGVLDDGPRETALWTWVGRGLIALFVVTMVIGALRGGIL